MAKGDEDTRRPVKNTSIYSVPFTAKLFYITHT